MSRLLTSRPSKGLAWMGELESIQTGRAWQFQGVATLVDLLTAQLSAAPLQPHQTGDTL